MYKYIFIICSALVLLLSACGIYKNRGKIDTDKDVKAEKEQLNFQLSFFEGNKQKMLENYQEAGSYYFNCLSIDPKSGAANYEFARLLFLGEDYSSALKYARNAHEFDPDNKWYHALYVSCHKSLGDYKKASQILEEMLEKHPDDYNSYLELIDMYLYVKDEKKALETLNKLEEQYGYSEPLMVEKNRIYIRKGDYSSARLEVQKMIKKEPENLSYYIILGDLYAEEKQYDRAYEIYQQVLKKDPNNGTVHFSLSEYYNRKGNNDKSYEELQKAFRSTQVSVELKIKLLSGYLNVQNPTETDKKQVYTLMNILRDLYLDNMQVSSLYSDMLVKDKKYKEAQKELGIIIRSNPDKYVVWEQLLYVDNQLSAFDSLYYHSEDMISYFPNQPIAYFFAGLAGYQIEKYKESAEYLEIGADYALSDTTLQAQFQTLLGDSYHRLKNNDKSDKAYEKSISLEPTNYYVCNNYAYYLSVRKENLNRAEELMKKCVQVHSDDATYLDTYAWILYQMEKYEKALFVIQQAYQNGGDKNAVIVEHYGDILYKNSREQEALDKWKEAKDIGKGSPQLDSKIEFGKLIDN